MALYKSYFVIYYYDSQAFSVTCRNTILLAIGDLRLSSLSRVTSQLLFTSNHNLSSIATARDSDFGLSWLTV